VILVDVLIWLIEELACDVALYWGLPDLEILARPVSWLFEIYERVDRARWNESQRQIASVQLGTMRALALALGSKKLPPLPDYDDTLAERRDTLPAWHSKFEEANPGRARIIGLSAATGSPPK
jgi:hypothetical protein